MSKKSLVPVNILALESAPSGAHVGDVYFNTVTNTLYAYDGTDWTVEYIDAEAIANLIAGATLDSTDDLPEGLQHLYYTDTRVGTYITNNQASLQGAQGTQGTQGAIGSTGLQGAIGATGSQGATGAQGAEGTQGATGQTGAQGTTGSQGVQGVQGYSGVDGNSSSYYKYKADTSKTSGDPGNGGTLYWNNATQTSATVIVLDHLTADGIDIDVFLSLLKTGDSIIIQDSNNSDNYQQWAVNGAETVYPNNYVTVPVTLTTSAGTGTTGFSNNSDLIVVIIATGVQGPTGAQGATGAQGTTGAQGATGTQGAAGTDGAQGATGTQGPIGSTGVQGAIGATGSQGDTGTQGATGAQGATGPSDFTMVIMGAY